MSIRANTIVDGSRRCYKAIKPLLCLACLVVCLVGLVPTASAIDAPYPFNNTAYNIVTVSARPYQLSAVSFTNPMVGVLQSEDSLEYPYSQQIYYVFEGEDAYYFDSTNPIKLTGAFCLDDRYCLSLLFDYQGGSYDITYSGYFLKINQDGYKDDIDYGNGTQIGRLQVTLDEYSPLNAQNFGYSPSTDDIYYFIGTVEIMAETYGNVAIGLRNMIAEGNNINPLFHTFDSLNIVDLGNKWISANGAYQLSYVQDGTIYLHPSVAVQVIGDDEENSHYWLLRSIEPVFNTPIFGNNFTIGTLILILMAVALLSLVLKLCFGG